MRVITGSAKGLRLKAPVGWATRPTGDRVKESLFSILGQRVVGAKVLDLFAGTGNLGIEALSRGAESAVFVDENSGCAKIIRENLAHTHLEQAGGVRRGDVFTVLRQLAAEGSSFDLVFCDPPYDKGFVDKVLQLVAEKNLLAPRGTLIMEHSGREKAAPIEPVRCVRQERYGQTRISFFQREIAGTAVLHSSQNEED